MHLQIMLIAVMPLQYCGDYWVTAISASESPPTSDCCVLKMFRYRGSLLAGVSTSMKWRQANTKESTSLAAGSLGLHYLGRRYDAGRMYLFSPKTAPLS